MSYCLFVNKVDLLTDHFITPIQLLVETNATASILYCPYKENMSILQMQH